MDKSWGQWLRENFDKLLLALLFLALIGVLVHMSHDQRDAQEIGWIRETAGGVLASLLTVITGHALASKATATAAGATAATKTE